MQKKWLAVLLCIAMVLCNFTGCKGTPDIVSGIASQEYPVTVSGVTLKEAPKGVAVLSQNLADVILALGYEIQLKAKSEDCKQSDLSVLPNVSFDKLDAIKNCGADTVLVDTAPSEEQVKACSDAGIRVISIAPAKGREDFARLYTEVGSILKGSKTGYERGKKIASSIFSTIDDVARELPQTDTPTTVAYLFDTEGGAATGDTMQGELIEDAGLLNAVSDGTNNKIDISSLVMVQPKFIFCPTGLKAKLASTEGYKDLTAVQEGRVYEMDPSLMTLQGRGMVDAVTFMAGTVFPELTKGQPIVSSSEPPQSKPSTSSVINIGGDSSSQPQTSSSPAGSSSAVSSGSSTVLQRGSQGDDVLKLQNRLAELGYLFVKPSGLFAEGTEQSVKDFQYINGLQATGIADAKTLALLYSDSAKRRS